MLPLLMMLPAPLLLHVGRGVLHAEHDAAHQRRHRRVEPLGLEALDAAGLRRPAITILAPSATKTSAVRNPIPLVAPVITATLPSSLPMECSCFRVI